VGPTIGPAAVAPLKKQTTSQQPAPHVQQHHLNSAGVTALVLKLAHIAAAAAT
jgi:hypothetical protein